jgi:hypothetical protein
MALEKAITIQPNVSNQACISHIEHTGLSGRIRHDPLLPCLAETDDALTIGVNPQLLRCC